jgi:hypothetical protein
VRLAIEKLVIHILVGDTGKDLNANIEILVKKGLASEA